ncbi:hypothetical protein MMC25_006508 [Agyrium rufum]|nr:hypothetical protein [Agyrium rufum]
MEPLAKRRRLSLLHNSATLPQLNGSAVASIFAEEATGKKRNVALDDDDSIAISSTSKYAGQKVAPFLAKHIPDSYAPLGNADRPKNSSEGNMSSKFCYRHRPDLKCRRKADEPSMDQLQHELESLSQNDQQGISHVWTLFSAAPAKQRQLMLQGILTQCCFPQLSYLSNNVRELIRIDFLSALPTEIGFKILCYLDTISLCKAAQVSQRWRALADDDVVWHRMCEQHIDRKCTKCGWGLPLLERKRLRASKRQIQLRATGKAITSPTTPQGNGLPAIQVNSGPSGIAYPLTPPATDGISAACNSEPIGKVAPPERPPNVTRNSSLLEPRFRPWKDVYKDRFKVGSNWKHGRYTTRIFKGHTNGVMCLQFDDHILATGSYDATIKIWDIESGKELRTLHGHTAGVRCLQFDEHKLISGSLDHCLKVWNWRTGECISTYSGHSAGIIGLHFDSMMLVSGSMDHTLRIWNFQDKQTCVLRGHEDWVNAVRVDTASRTVFSASDDCTVRLWDLDTKSTIKIYKGHVGQVQQVLPLPPEFELDDDANDGDGTSDDDAASATSTSALATISAAIAYSAHARAAVTFAEPFHAADRPLPPRYMLTGALDSTIRLWDVHTGKCIRTFFGHIEGIWALGADTLRIVSGSEDRTVKVWDARTGKCERNFTGHAGPVTCIGLSDSRICTGSEDCEVRVYSFKGPVCAPLEGGDGMKEEGQGQGPGR